MICSIVKAQFIKDWRRKVTEEYCTEVIKNIVALLKEGYIYLDFYKSPIKPKADESYSIDQIDLVGELEAIPTKDRKFYEFVRDIRKIIRKTGDEHLNFYPENSPGGLNLGLCAFSLPFQFDVFDELDNEGNLKETYLIIREKDAEFEETPENDNYNNNEEENENDNKKENEEENGKENEKEKEGSSSEYAKYYNKKIKSINGEDPFVYINTLYKDYIITHSPQSHYVISLRLSNEINLMRYPFLKEELSNIKIVFEDDEELTVDYSMPSDDDFDSPEFANYYLKKVKFDIINNIPTESLSSIKEEFKYRNDLNYKMRRKLDDIDWDIKGEKNMIKCKVDHENKKNVLYQNSISEGLDDFQYVMENCMDLFYSNKYEIIVIQSQNTGGLSDMCTPMTQYFRPKIFTSLPFSHKDTDLNYEYFERGSLIYENCIPSDREQLNRGMTMAMV